ncbi:MAG TPA: ABC transporter substrate-binding protein, partial [Chloroflexota bacterium]
MTSLARARYALFLLVLAGALSVIVLGGGIPAGAATQRNTALAFCSPGSKAQGTVTVSDWQSPDTLNPFQSSQLITSEVAAALFDHLFTYSSSGRVVPQMAASIPTVRNGGVRDGGRTVTIHLKSGLRWSNGSPITSADIRFGWQVGMDRSSGPDCLGSCDAISGIDLPNRNTAILRLRHAVSQPIPGILPNLWPPVWRGAWTHSAHAAALQIYTVPSFTFETGGYPTDGPYQVASFKNGRILLHPMRYYGGVPCGARIRTLLFT